MLLDLLALLDEGAAAVETLTGRARRLVRPFRAPPVTPGKPLHQPVPDRPQVAAWTKLAAGRSVRVIGLAGVRTGGASIVLLKRVRPDEALPDVPVLDLPLPVQEQRVYTRPAIHRAVAQAPVRQLQFGRMPGRHLVKEAQAGLRSGGQATILAWGLAEREDEDLLNIA